MRQPCSSGMLVMKVLVLVDIVTCSMNSDQSFLKLRLDLTIKPASISRSS
jgi:hypothetical protein